MSGLGDILGAIRRIALLDERVLRLQHDFGTLEPFVQQMNARLSRLEGLLEMAMHVDRRRLDRD